MNNYPTIRHFQYLRALEQTNNFAKAAEECLVTQPTLSAGIKEMENILGLPLIDRGTGKKMLFTAYGRDVLQTAHQIMNNLEALGDITRERAKPLSGPFRIGLIPTIAPYLLPTILPYLQKHFPDMDFQITEKMSHILVEQLEQGLLDYVIMAFPFDTPSLMQDMFFEEPFLCAAPHNTFKAKTITLNDLDDHKILLLEDGHCLREHALSACRLQNIHEKQTFSATSLPTLVQMAAQGYGLTLLPEMMVKNEILPDSLSLYKFKKPLPTRTIGGLWRPSSTKNNNIQAVHKKLRPLLKL